MSKKNSSGISSVPTFWFVGGLVVVSVVLLLVLDNYWITVISLAMALGLFAFGVDVLQWAGLSSLGHAAWYGLAAYGTAILTVKLGWNPWLAMMAGIAMSMAVAAAFAPFAVRMKGTSFLVITLAFGQVIWGLAIKLEKVTGGSDGIPGVPRPGSIGPINFGDPKVMFALM
ncbi:MAG: branched-chain amino acid ABC transporter permease, partial [Actinobacteria bacterium]|nr:branched-chain amino acid ABC transporter permease [Actinomycetota bacterium]